MKLFIILLLTSFTAYGRVPPMSCNSVTIDPSKYTSDQLKAYYCEVNFQCTVIALNTESIFWDEVDKRRDYSTKNECNDELKLAAMMMEMSKNPPSLHAEVSPEINHSDRNLSKEDLPVIPDAPSENSKVKSE